MMRNTTLDSLSVICLVPILIAMGCVRATSQVNYAATLPSIDREPPVATTHVVPEDSSARTLQPGDRIRLTIADRDSPALNQVVRRTVDETGAVSWPYIGKVRVAGQTTEELGIELRKRYERVDGWADEFLVDFDEDKPLAPMEQLGSQGQSGGPNRLVQPGDRLCITLHTFEFGYLSNELHRTVDQAGRILLPFLGRVRVGGRTTREMEAELKALFDSNTDSWAEKYDVRFE